MVKSHAALPEMHARIGRQVQLRVGLYAHRVIPRIYIANRTGDAEFGRAVRIGQHPLPCRFFPGFVAPHLGMGQK